MLTRIRRSCAILTALSVAGCSSENSDYAQYYKLMRQSIAASFVTVRVSRAQAASIPYATMGYRVNNGAEQIIVLATETRGEQLWTSAAHIVIVTNGGRIVRTVGLPHDVAGMTPQTGGRLSMVSDALERDITSVRREDFPDIAIYGAAVVCTSSRRGQETITILGLGISTLRVDEVCRSDELKWSFTDSFWLDFSSGLVWRSTQHVSPNGDILKTEILRPPG